MNNPAPHPPETSGAEHTPESSNFLNPDHTETKGQNKEALFTLIYESATRKHVKVREIQV